MNGLISRGLYSYVRGHHGSALWSDAVAEAGLAPGEFEAMLTYEDALTSRMFDAVAGLLKRPRPNVMEEVGTHMLTNPGGESIRRLLRFVGATFEDFLNSLDDLPERTRLAVPHFNLPEMRLRKHSGGQYSLLCAAPVAGYGHVMVGLLRVMADDYRALALFEHRGTGPEGDCVAITLIETSHSVGQTFVSGARAG